MPEVREGIGVLVGFLILAGFAVAVKPGSQTANVLKAGTDGFASMVRAATLQAA